MDFLKCLFPRIEVCIRIAKHVLAKKEPEMEACIQEYKAAKEEVHLYRPFYFMANRILELASWIEAHQYAGLKNLPYVPPPSGALIRDFKVRYPDANYSEAYGTLAGESVTSGTSVRAFDGLREIVMLDTHTKSLQGCPEDRA